MLLTEHNQPEVRSYIKNAKELQINRIAVRKIVGREDEFKIFEEREPTKHIFGNPVYEIDEVEVTVWDYTKSMVSGLYLFPDGSLRNKFRGNF